MDTSDLFGILLLALTFLIFIGLIIYAFIKLDGQSRVRLISLIIFLALIIGACYFIYERESGIILISGTDTTQIDTAVVSATFLTDTADIHSTVQPDAEDKAPTDQPVTEDISPKDPTEMTVVPPEEQPVTIVATATEQPVTMDKPPVNESKSKPKPVTSSLPKVENGKFELIVVGVSKRESADAYIRKLETAGISAKIIKTTNNGNPWFRVSIGSYDNKNDADKQAEEMKSQPHCENVWVAKSNN